MKLNFNKTLSTLDLEQRLKEIEDQKKALAVEEVKLLEKAFKGDDVNTIVKAQDYYDKVRSRDSKTGNKSLILDPHQMVAQGKYLERGINVSYSMLRAMSRTPIPRAIISTRKDQIAEFATPQHNKYGVGYVIRPKKSGSNEGDDDKISDKEKKRIDEIIEFINSGGTEENEWGKTQSFESFIRKIVEDSLIFDQSTFEIVRNRGGEITEFFATDGSTYRFADNSIDDQTQKKNGYKPTIVQVYENKIVAEFYPWELAFGIRNPQTDLRSNGYGRSELEDLISTVTSMLYSDQYNSNFFKVGSNPKGILRVQGAIGQPRLDEFKQQWLSQVAGVQNSHKLPVIEADKMEWVSTQMPNKDMEFSKYQEYLIRVACAIYKISPVEIGFNIEGENAPSIGNKSNKDELIYSKDKGLKPLLRFIERLVNKYLIKPYDENYELVFVGLDAESEQEEQDRLIKLAGGPVLTVSEARKKLGYDPREKDFDFLQSPVAMQKEQMQQMGGEQSNAFMDEEEKSEENPMIKGFSNFVEKMNYEDKL